MLTAESQAFKEAESCSGGRFTGASRPLIRPYLNGAVDRPRWITEDENALSMLERILQCKQLFPRNLIFFRFKVRIVVSVQSYSLSKGIHNCPIYSLTLYMGDSFRCTIENKITQSLLTCLYFVYSTSTLAHKHDILVTLLENSNQIQHRSCKHALLMLNSSKPQH
jgi:hypothetical protein